MDVHGTIGPHTIPLDVWESSESGEALDNSFDLLRRDNTISSKVLWNSSYRCKKDPIYYRTLQSKALEQCKNEIQREERWDDYKKITNPYEYVFLSWNRRSSRSVSKRQPLSRSYFKMVEMWKAAELEEDLMNCIQIDGLLKTAHAAEGPGGFIEACWEKASQRRWTVSNTFAITLRSDARNVPGWRKAAAFLEERPTIEICDGADGTGNILQESNQDAFVNRVRSVCPEGVHIYTADGGFDFSSDYNAQENIIFPLLLAESLLAIRVLGKGGCMVLKCFDTTELPTLDLLWCLSLCFREWRIMKPKTSRAGNAERYFIGKGFLGDVSDIQSILLTVQRKQTWNQPLLKTRSKNWNEWKQTVLGLQERIEIQEYTIIRETLDLIQSCDFSKIRNLVRENIQRSIAWCNDYNEPISILWLHEQERNILREVHDLLHILQPQVSSQNHSWYNRRVSSSNISFEGFRSMPTNSSEDRSQNQFRFRNATLTLSCE